MDIKKVVNGIFFVQFYIQFSGGLNCYLCPRTVGQSAEDANIECLALGWDISCSPDQDRCYSRWYEEGIVVEKGCSRSEECVGTTSCCNDDFCNADPQSSKTGHGKSCTTASDCIQGESTMMCAKEDITDLEKVCRCKGDSYKRGATCKLKSYPSEPCLLSEHCYDVNTTCIGQRCKCDDWMFPNGTKCDYQILLGEQCAVNKECGGRNTACIDNNCACVFGYYVINGTSSCSHSTTVGPSVYSTILTTILAFIIDQGR